LKRSILTVIMTAAMTSALPPSSPAAGPGLDHRYSGELSWWGLGTVAESGNTWNVGARYLPAFTINRESRGGNMIDLYVYLNAFAAASGAEDYDEYKLDLYRLVFRYTTHRTETRIGLQKIVFGPAMILRSMMWFDSIDPRDPQQLTEGVYALRFRYDALDNSSLWLWGIYPDGERKGLEVVPSEEGYPEFGGRYLRPVPSGEMALTFNSRQAELAGTGLEFRENRLGLDGKWDIKIGLWFEAVLQHQDEDFIPMQWRKMLTLGADYTFGVGNGLYVVLEHMGIFMSEGAWGSDEDYQTTAWMANYPIGFMDNLSAIGYYSWEAEKYYQYAAWQRTWDSWMLHVSAFCYPETDASFSLYGEGQPLSGTGGQILVIFNH
jgi:hypothetical protein